MERVNEMLVIIKKVEASNTEHDLSTSVVYNSNFRGGGCIFIILGYSIKKKEKGSKASRGTI